MLHNKTLQSDKANLSRLLLPQKARQLAFAADRGRWAAPR
jgi:hypothetical protein